MTSHHAPKPSRSLKGRPVALQWDLDQELQDRTASIDATISDIVKLTSQHLSTSVANLDKSCQLREGEGGERAGGVISKDITSPAPAPASFSPCSPSLPPPPPSPAAINADPETLKNIQEWMQRNSIHCINFLCRNYSEDQLAQAKEDFERAVKHGEKIRSPGGFFRSLLT